MVMGLYVRSMAASFRRALRRGFDRLLAVPRAIRDRDTEMSRAARSVSDRGQQDAVDEAG